MLAALAVGGVSCTGKANRGGTGSVAAPANPSAPPTGHAQAAVATQPGARAYAPPKIGPASNFTTSTAPAAATRAAHSKPVADQPPDLDAAHAAYAEGTRLLLGIGRKQNVQQGMKLIEAAARNGDPHAIAMIVSQPRELSRRSRIVIVPTIQSRDDARELEEALKLDPLDVGGRLQLLLYYRKLHAEIASTTAGGSAPAKADDVDDRIRQHMSWLIENCPGAPFMPVPWDESGTFTLADISYFDRESDEKVKSFKDAWLHQVELHPSDPGILTNAATYLRTGNFSLSQDLMERVEELKDPAIRLRRLTDSRETIKSRERLLKLDGPARNRLAQELLLAAERIIRITDGTTNERELAERADMYRIAGMSSLERGFYERAKRYGNVLLDSRFKRELDTFPLAAHYGHVILGRIALQDKDIAAAKEHLLKAQEALPVKWPASIWGKRLDGDYPIHPDVSLAQELLEAGAREEVLKYLERCADLTFPGPAGDWVEQIRSRKRPDFTEALDY